MMRPIVTILGLAAVIAASQPLGAQPASPPAAQAAAKPAEDAKAEAGKGAEPARVDTSKMMLKDDFVVTTKHSLTIDGRAMGYTATTGTITLRTEEGKPRANIFFIAYTRDGVTDTAARPLTFSFNGGPGSSSVWLHLGTLGPRRVQMDMDGRMLAPPARLIDNESSILDLTDIVFLDPVTTGFSRTAAGEDPKNYHGVREDVESVGEFIRMYLARYTRWSSPKFLIGESYGTTRAAGLSGYLQQRHGIYLNGIMLVSSILNFQTADFEFGNDLPYVLYVPTYAATAWYHKKLAPELAADLKKTLAEAERFAMGEYTLALMKGSTLTAAERKDLAAKLSRLTGLSPQYIEETNFRIDIMRFTKELLRDRRQTAGRLDSRFTGTDVDAAGERFEYDPSMAAIMGPYTGAMNDYVRRDLKFESDLPYEILTGRVQPWKYSDFQNRYVDVSNTLRSAMMQNPYLKVFVANGYYDLATPYFATEYTFNHMSFDPGFRDRVTMTYYESGHMMYIHQPSLKQLKADIASFMKATLAGAMPPARSTAQQ